MGQMITDGIRDLVKTYHSLKTWDMHWGALHICVEDGNMRDTDLDGCIDSTNPPMTEDDWAMLEFLRPLPERVRDIIWERGRRDP